MPENRTYLRPIGFRPWEISSMINQEVIDQHAEEAAFLWTQRDHAAISPQYALKDLAKLDERVEAHVDGLRVAGSHGLGAAFQQIEDGPGELFAASVLAFESGDRDRIESVLKIAWSAPRLLRAAISAIGWIPADQAEDEAKKLAESTDVAEKALGIAGLSVHRIDPGESLRSALNHPDTTLASRAARAAGELGRRDLLPDLLSRTSSDVERLRFWSAWSSVRLGDRHVAPSVLMNFLDPTNAFAVRALRVILPVVGSKGGLSLFEASAADTAALRVAVTAAAVIGDPILVPWLIRQMEEPALARPAGASFSSITGVDLGYLDLEGDAPASWDIDDEVLAPSEDGNLQWPSPDRITQWWEAHSSSFIPGTRYLAGKPITDDSLREVLAKGRQDQRAAAALELGIRHPEDQLFETRARAQRQLKKVALWSL